MAEIKKPVKPVKPAKPQKIMSDEDTIGEIIFLLGALILLGAIATALMNLIEGSGLLSASDGLWHRIVEYFLTHIWPFWKVFAMAIVTLSGIGAIYSLRGVQKVAATEALIFNPASGAAESAIFFSGKKQADRWEKIVAHANSSNPNDWRWAIIEADIFLEESLKAGGFLGDNIGEILKSMTKGDLATLDAAWDAHKTRNRIAHDGSKFDLSERETKRVILLFESALKELGAI